MVTLRSFKSHCKRKANTISFAKPGNRTLARFSDLVGEQEAGNAASVHEGALGVEVPLPLGHAEEGLPVGEVEHDDAAARVAVVDAGHPRESLLACENRSAFVSPVWF